MAERHAKQFLVKVGSFVPKNLWSPFTQIWNMFQPLLWKKLLFESSNFDKKLQRQLSLDLLCTFSSSITSSLNYEDSKVCKF